MLAVVAIEEDADGRPDMVMLARELHKFSTRPLKIGSLSAGSNVTGIRADTTGVACLLRAVVCSPRSDPHALAVAQ